MPEDQPTSPPPPPPPASAPPPPQQAYAPPYPPQYPYAQPAPYPVYALPPRQRRSPWFWVAIIGGSFAAVALLITAMVWSTVRSLSGDSAGLDGFGGSRIAVIDLDGVILD